MWNLIPSRKRSEDQPPQPTFIKRGCLRIALNNLLPIPPVPPSFEWVAWHDDLREAHAKTLFESFQQSIDSIVFPNLGNPSGCALIVDSICGHPHFCEEGTWLLTRKGEPVGTVQALLNPDASLGMIQNIGVIPEYRGYGLGKILLLKLLHALRDKGIHSAQLEVTMKNHIALNLYYALGFRRRRILYREVSPSENETYSI